MIDLHLVYSNSLPQPSARDPLAQIRYVYKERGDVANTKATAEAYWTAFRNHVRYIVDRDGYPNEEAIRPVFVEDEFSVDFFFQMHQWHLRRGIHNLSTTLSALREVIRHCRSNGYITTDVIITKVRTTHRDAHSGNTHIAYGDDLYPFVRQVLVNEYQFLRKVAAPYVVTGVGQDPRVKWNPCWAMRLEVLRLFQRLLSTKSGIVTFDEIIPELQRILDRQDNQFFRCQVRMAIEFVDAQGYIEAQPFCGAIVSFRKTIAEAQLRETIGSQTVNKQAALKRRLALQEQIQRRSLNGTADVYLPLVRRRPSQWNRDVRTFTDDLEAFEKSGGVTVSQRVHLTDSAYHVTVMKSPDATLEERADEMRYGWGNKDNWRWYFEHVMDCRIPSTAYNRNPEYVSFTKNVSRYFLQHTQERDNLQEVYDTGDKDEVSSALLASWGVVRRLRAGLVISLMAYLAKLTGLNVESLKDLKLGCLKFEPLTQTYYLEYFKARSTGRKELPLADSSAEEWVIEGEEVLEKSEYQGTTDDGKRTAHRKPIAFLPDARRIQDIIKLVESLTLPFRKRAPRELRDKLFLFETRNPDSHGHFRVTDINRYHFIDWVRNDFKPRVARLMKRSLGARQPNLAKETLRKEERKIDRQIENTSLAVSRLRSTLATNLVKQGAPIELVQAVLGHSNLLTTEQYLDKLQLESTLYQEVKTALDRLKNDKSIHVRMVGSVEKLREVIATSPDDKAGEGYIYETPGCLHCRDPSNPSTKVKRQHRTWIEGESTCAKWNMCLFCENVIIVDVVLPRLIAYQTKLKMDLSSGLISVRVNNVLARKTVRLIDEILDPKNGFFSEKVVDDARARAEAWIDRDLAEFFLGEVEGSQM